MDEIVHVAFVSRYSTHSRSFHDLVRKHEIPVKFVFIDHVDVRKYAEEYLTFVPTLISVHINKGEVKKFEGEKAFLKIQDLIDKHEALSEAMIARREKVSKEDVRNLISEQATDQTTIKETVLETAKRLQRDHDAS